MKKNRKKFLLVVLLFLAGVLCFSLAGTEQVQAARRNGFVRIHNNKYYYKNGKRVKGWKKIGKYRYYFQPSKKGAAATGLTDIGSKRYCFRKSGVRYYRKGIYKIGGKYYLITGGGYCRTGWVTWKGKKYFFTESGANKGAAKTGTHKMNGWNYTFDKRGRLIRSAKIKPPSNEEQNKLQLPTKDATVRNFLLHALRSIGTPYRLGGGWETYDRKTIPPYLDCSGFVSWAVEQAISPSRNSLVKSFRVPETYASYQWGALRRHSVLKQGNFYGQFQAGDVVSIMHDPKHPNTSTGHVWIVIGQCSDGSYLLVHGSPPCVQIAGTPTPDNVVGEAVELARTYMARYYPNVVSTYKINEMSTSGTDLYSYMTQSSIQSFRFSDALLSDPQGFRSKTAAQIMKILFNEP